MRNVLLTVGKIVNRLVIMGERGEMVTVEPTKQWKVTVGQREGLVIVGHRR